MILVTGCDGMLGSDIMYMGKDVIGADIKTFDISILKDTIDFITEKKPSIIINCAAVTNVDQCETDSDSAFKVNSIGAGNIAVAASNINAKLIHVSTDYVFDGKQGRPYIEGDVTAPINVYGKSKLDGENFVKSLSNRHFIVRTQWLYGKHGKNFVKTMLDLSQTRKQLNVVADQYGSPTYTKDLAAALLALSSTDAYGTYHITNSGVISWYEFAQTIFNLKGIDIDIKPVSTDEFPRPAVRPAYSALKNYNWTLSGFKPLRHYEQALREYLTEVS